MSAVNRTLYKALLRTSGANEMTTWQRAVVAANPSLRRMAGGLNWFLGNESARASVRRITRDVVSQGKETESCTAGFVALRALNVGSRNESPVQRCQATLVDALEQSQALRRQPASPSSPGSLSPSSSMHFSWDPSASSLSSASSSSTSSTPFVAPRSPSQLSASTTASRRATAESDSYTRGGQLAVRTAPRPEVATLELPEDAVEDRESHKSARERRVRVVETVLSQLKDAAEGKGNGFSFHRPVRRTSYDALLAVAIEESDPSLALLVLDALFASSYRLSSSMQASLAELFSRAGHTQGVLLILRESLNTNQTPSFASSSSSVPSASSFTSSCPAVSSLSSLPSSAAPLRMPSTPQQETLRHVINCALVAAANAADASLAQDLASFARKQGMTLGAANYEALLMAAVHARKPATARKHLARMQEEGHSLSAPVAAAIQQMLPSVVANLPPALAPAPASTSRGPVPSSSALSSASA